MYMYKVQYWEGYFRWLLLISSKIDAFRALSHADVWASYLGIPIYSDPPERRSQLGFGFMLNFHPFVHEICLGVTTW
jgi:hypothetical protein